VESCYLFRSADRVSHAFDADITVLPRRSRLEERKLSIPGSETALDARMNPLYDYTIARAALRGATGATPEALARE
jgi:hypothetical protein